jgi:signal transduction histidine kinase
MKTRLNNATENSLDLYFVVSHACASQSGEGFQEFVNTINRDDIKKKIKRLTIVDTSYLYRHTILEFAKYADWNIETEWGSKNKDVIAQIKCNYRMKSWAEELHSSEFQEWYRQIKKDFDGDGDKNEIITEFRDNVIKEATVASYKGNGNFDGCVEFILEEAAYTCAFLHNVNLIYPAKMFQSILNCASRHHRNIIHFPYKLSKKAMNLNDTVKIEFASLEKEVTFFMKNQVSHVNFFVIDKHGNQIYKNYALDRVIGNINSKTLQSWEISKKVMKTRKEVVAEEKYKDNYYLSFKAPLIIDNKVEGVIGLAIDITDRKKKEELEKQNKFQNIMLEKQAEFAKLTGEVVHDIRSPIISLEMLAKRNSLPEEEHIILRSVISKIKEMSNTLLFWYKENRRIECDLRTQPILVSLVLSEIVAQKNVQLINSNIKVRCSYAFKDGLAFIMGDQVTIGRMIFNLINNAVEAIGNEQNGTVNVNMFTDGENVKIIVQDNGLGMSSEIIEKIYNRSRCIGTTKKVGSGIGLVQIFSTVDMYKGKLDVESKEGEGTKFTITFPQTSKAECIQDTIILRKGSIIVCLDDDESMRATWEKLLAPYSNDLKLHFFTNNKDASSFLLLHSDGKNVFLISDYELRNQSTDGLFFILEHKMQNRSLIVTNMNNDGELQEKIKWAGIAMFPKQFLPNLRIKLT